MHFFQLMTHTTGTIVCAALSSKSNFLWAWWQIKKRSSSNCHYAHSVPFKVTRYKQPYLISLLCSVQGGLVWIFIDLQFFSAYKNELITAIFFLLLHNINSNLIWLHCCIKCPQILREKTSSQNSKLPSKYNGIFFIIIRWHHEIDFAGNTCRI